MQQQPKSSNVHVGEANPFETVANTNLIHRFTIPDRVVGMVIGRNQETIKGIAHKSNTRIFVASRSRLDQEGMRQVEVIGSTMEQKIAEGLINEMIETGPAPVDIR